MFQPGYPTQGSSVALSADGNMALVGGDGPAGAAWIFQRQAGAWTQAEDKIKGADGSAFAEQGMGVALSADGSTALIGGPLDFPNNGATWAFATPQPSNLSLSTSNNPSLLSQEVTYTATLASGARGLVALTVDGIPRHLALLNGNQSQVTLSDLSIGNHTIGAVYDGDAVFLGSAASLIQTVNPKPRLPVTATLNSSENPSMVGRPVTFGVSLAGGDGSFGGTLEFFDGIVSMGFAAITRGQASFTTAALSKGLHGIVAKYRGDTSTQVAIAQVVNGIPSATTISANTTSAVYGQAIVLTTRVGPAPPAGYAFPGGHVLFQDNGHPAGAVAITAGEATLTLNNLAMGTHLITALYGGDNLWAGSFAGTTVVITQPIWRRAGSRPVAPQ